MFWFNIVIIYVLPPNISGDELAVLLATAHHVLVGGFILMAGLLVPACLATMVRMEVKAMAPAVGVGVKASDESGD